MAAVTSNIQLKHTATLNGRSYEADSTTQVPNIEQIGDKSRTILAASEQTLVALGAAATDDWADFEYILFENTDVTNFVTLGFKSGSEEMYIKLPPNAQHLMMTSLMNANSAGGGFGAFVEIDTITGQADTGNVFVNITVGVKQP